MSIYNYEEIIQELKDKGVITGQDVFDFSLYPNKHIFEEFFQFCQVNLSEVCVELGYNIEPAKLYFTNRTSVNACAAHGEKYYVIKINMGAIHNVFDLFCNNDILEDEELLTYKEFNDLIVKDKGASIVFLMFQAAIQFTYYHELGHLIQFSQQGGGKASIAEQYTGTNGKFEPLKHIMEYDADNHGTHNVAFHTDDFWNHLSSSLKTEDNLRKLIVISLTGILGYIFFLWQSLKEDIYYDKYDHPHPLIRVTWIVGIFINTLETKYDSIHRSEIIEETVRVLDIYFKHKGEDRLRTRFEGPLAQEYENIVGYCESVLQWAEKIPFLTTNTVHKS